MLVVEDEPLLADAIAEWLRREAHAVDVAYDGDAALERLGVNDYDVVVLDRDLPVVHGDDVCRAAGRRRAATTRVLMLTAAAAVGDRVAGLALGADDYLAKPFALRRAVARVHALGRRARAGRAAGAAPGRDQPRPGPARGHPGRALRAAVPQGVRACWPSCCAPTARWSPPRSCWRRAWDEHVDPFTNVVRVTIMKLRRKLGDPPVIETVPGVGYRIPMRTPAPIRARLTLSTAACSCWPAWSCSA